MWRPVDLLCFRWTLFALALCVLPTVQGAHTHAPIILLPGLGGSALEARLNRSSAPAWYCSTSHDWQVAWFSAYEATRPDCFLDELQVIYDPVTKRYHNQTGVEVRPYDFGGLDGVKSIDPSSSYFYGTYVELVKELTGNHGYNEGVNLFGAPYDFRLAADGLEQVGFFQNLTNVVEAAVEKNAGRPALLVAHSMGCLVTLYFLMHQTAEWKAQHIQGFVAISAPWAGSVTALKGSISGDNFDVRFIPHSLLRPLQCTTPSLPWFFPAADLWGDEVLVSTTGGHNYTARDVLPLLNDLNLTQQAAVYPLTHNLTYPLPQIDVPTYCLFGTDLDTDTGYLYDVDKFDASAPPAPKEKRRGPGDGTVSSLSLEQCSKLGPKADLQRFRHAEHTRILQDKRAIASIVDIATHRRSGAMRDLFLPVAPRVVFAKLSGWASWATSHFRSQAQFFKQEQ
ncbi:hypothetical protein WJX72_001833 [[Myrmecia] bisecta]|uniref:Uncharacterized protein n=1 Tax=[Myrmecia] bisecta TaxID=41462 RepID=A0AAW1Q1K1_9CHLO